MQDILRWWLLIMFILIKTLARGGCIVSRCTRTNIAALKVHVRTPWSPVLFLTLHKKTDWSNVTENLSFLWVLCGKWLQNTWERYVLFVQPLSKINGERGTRTYNVGLGAVPPWCPGAKPLVRALRGSGGEAHPQKLTKFWQLRPSNLRWNVCALARNIQIPSY